MRRTIIIVLCLAAILVAGPARGAAHWLHVTVDDHVDSSRPERVTLNIPFSVIERALPLIPERALREARIDVGCADFDHAEIGALVDDARRANENEIVSIRTDNEIVQAFRNGDTFVLRVEDLEGRRGRVELQVPMSLAEAVVSGGTLDFRRLVDALARRRAGEILMSNEDDSRVRVWIDDAPDASRGRRP